MNRENKRRKYDKNYYKKNPCTESFTCKNCGWPIVSNGAGSNHRNHCPNCLCSVHVDNKPGDRDSGCGSIMDPIGAWVRKDGEWALIHRCRYCGSMSSNRIAADDNPMKLMALAMRPILSDIVPQDQALKMLDTMESQGDLI
ncbi:MAG: RNHCP domain-containing protein [Lachnospiraceae bacterium]|nr:RNHCP domain-containing protein [Lachnospiraceae bacterium]MEE3355624.1 RNHCP domain-containing protein [Candidatus Weimeria sp.]MBQ2576931.1 RNHCP domain-containing protein [Lachnospiraceae bacterium]MBQ5430636.1 RNHCP domain-containing protein [Lachnospiraceae bacterium]MBQ5485260.1 RNHCP domain-containing protein [Lachnospiraceae bacterium]